MSPDLPAEQIRDALDRLAHNVLAEAGVADPPVDALLLAERLGMVVARDPSAANRARFVRLGGIEVQPAILLADEPRSERRHWALAHEIGECMAYRAFAEWGVDPADADAGARERVANQLAGRLLLPRDWFFAAGVAENWSLPKLKRRFATASHELIARRMLDMPAPIIVTLCDQGRLQWRKANAGRRPPPMTPPEVAAWQVAHRTQRPARCEPAELPESVVDVRVWPIHEPDWRREIIRTELATDS